MTEAIGYINLNLAIKDDYGFVLDTIAEVTVFETYLETAEWNHTPSSLGFHHLIEIVSEGTALRLELLDRTVAFLSQLHTPDDTGDGPLTAHHRRLSNRLLTAKHTASRNIWHQFNPPDGGHLPSPINLPSTANSPDL